MVAVEHNTDSSEEDQDSENKSLSGHQHTGRHHHDPIHTGPGTIRFYVTIILNTVFATLELVYGLVSNSMALIADASHNFSDVLSLLLALAAVYLGRVAPSRHFTYGLGRSSLLIAITNGVILLMAAGAIAYEAIHQFYIIKPLPGLQIMVIAGVGAVINTASALFFLRGNQNDVNIQGALLHLAADAAVSMGVCLGGLAIYFTGWHWLDPAISLLIVAVIVWSTLKLLYTSIRLALDAVPAHIDIESLQSYFLSLPRVAQLHDLHIWSLSTTEVALTVHLVCPPDEEQNNAVSNDHLIKTIQSHLATHFGIQHSTIQIESYAPVRGCSQGQIQLLSSS